MDAKELIQIDGKKVRGNSNLMHIYITEYEKYFGTKPNCAGCSFGTDWGKFINAVQTGEPQFKTTNSIIMENTENTFKLKRIQGNILSYRVTNEETGKVKTYRLYDKNITESFVNGFLTNGTKEEIKERKALFSILPVDLREQKEEAKKTTSIEENTEATNTEAPVKKTRKKRKQRD